MSLNPAAPALEEEVADEIGESDFTASVDCDRYLAAIPGRAGRGGHPGRIEAASVRDRSATFIQVKPEDRRNPPVFVLQYGEKTQILPEWSGNGTLYLGEGLVAFSGQDGTRRIAKFRA